MTDENARKRTWIVPPEAAGMRIDLWLVKKNPGGSRGKIKKLLDEGAVFIGKKKVVMAGWKLKEGDRVSVQNSSVAGKVYLNVYFEDRDIIVVEKPSGFLTEPKEKSPRGNLLTLVKQYLQRKHPGIKDSYVKLLHRLDAETSGIVVLAKSKAGEALEADFRSHKIQRRYSAIVHGALDQGNGRIEYFLEEGDFGGGRKVRVAAGVDGKRAVTDFLVKERYPSATWLDITVHTGRTHQIRVHLEAIGHPILGDKIYRRDAVPFSRQALHASGLIFKHPVTGKKLQFESPLPADLKLLIDRLRLNDRM